MSQKNIDVTNVNDWANLLIGLLDKGEWKTLLFTLGLAFSITYTLKLVYFILVPSQSGHPNHIRLIAIVSGLIAALLAWKDNSISMQWYTAGLMVGPLSIITHHILIGISEMKVVMTLAPWFNKLIKGAIR